jgi:S-adenosylmethionine synthetase
VAQPLSIYVDTHGTGKVHETVLEKAMPQGHGSVAIAAFGPILT